MIVEAPWIGAGSAVELLEAHHYSGRQTALLWLQRWYENGEIHGRPCGPLAAKCDSFRARGLWLAADDAKAFRDASNAHLLSDAHVLDSLWEFDRAHVVAKCQGLAQEWAGQFEAEANAAPVLSYASLRHLTPTAATALLTWGDEALARRFRGAMLMCARGLPGTEAYADMPFGDDRASAEHEWRVAHGKRWREAQDRLSQAIGDGKVRVYDGEGPRLLLAPATMEDIEARGYFVNRDDVLRLQAASGTGGNAEVHLKPQPADVPPEATVPWAVHRIMERLGYPPDRAWNLLLGAVCTGELTPRKGTLFVPGKGPKLNQRQRENLDFDYRRYLADQQSGGPVASLRIGGECVHPHAITIPAEEVDHWLALHLAPDSLTTEMAASLHAIDSALDTGDWSSVLSVPRTPPSRPLSHEDWERKHGALRDLEWWLTTARKTSCGRTLAEARHLIGTALAEGKLGLEFRDGYLPPIGIDWRLFRIDLASRQLICPDGSRHRFEDVYLPFEQTAIRINELVRGAPPGFGPVGATEAPGPAVEPQDAQLTPASEGAIRKAMHEVYQTNDRPNVNDVVPLVQTALKTVGRRASKALIQRIAGEPAFAPRRRKQGEHRSRRARSDSDKTEIS